MKLIRGTLQKLQGPVFRGLHFALVVTLGGFDMMCYIALSCCWVLILVFVNNPPYVMIPHMSLSLEDTCFFPKLARGNIRAPHSCGQQCQHMSTHVNTIHIYMLTILDFKS